MISDSSFVRKITYGLMMAVLLIPLYFISRPSMRGRDGQLTEGGVLARLRNESGLSASDLGEIDPASESMKLVTLGMRGVAVNLLWEKSNKAKREHDYDTLTATLNQISKLQPNFISVWQFQAWNLAYNVSAEFDDYRSKYLWVKRGINFLRDGIRYNPQEPVLSWEIGWTFGHKIGRADEHLQFRRLYREDKDFHAEHATMINLQNTLGPDNKPDNWLTGREWFLRGQQLVDSGIPIRGRLVDDSDSIRRGKTPLIFHSHPAKWLISHAVAIEEEGILDEKAQYAWMRGGRAWDEYGQREIPTSYGFTIRLNEEQRYKDEMKRSGDRLDEMLPGVREAIEAEKRAALLPEERTALDTAPENRTADQEELATMAANKVKASYADIAARAPSDKRREARRLMNAGRSAEARSEAIRNYQDQVNYRYWKMRCEVEQMDTAIRARKLVFEADKAYKAADLVTMREKYEAAWDDWAVIFDKYPEMLEDATAEELMEAVIRYRFVLGQLDEPFPPPGFKLQKLLEAQSRIMEEAEAEAAAGQ